MAPIDWQAIRAQFPATRGQVYVSTASYGPGPERVLARVTEELRSWSAGHGRWMEWEQSGERARAAVATLLGTRPEQVGLLPAVSVAAAQIAERVPQRPGANLVVGGSEFRSNLYPWLAQEARGFEVRCVPFRDGRLEVEDLLAATDANTAVVAVSSVQSSNGYRIPLEPLAEGCRRHGARLFVDGTQSVGALRFPIELADYLVFAGYKWLLAPRGSAFLYVREELVAETAPLCAGWKTPQDPYGDYYGPPLKVAADASRFDISLAWPIWVGAAEALEFLLEIGIDEIEARDLALAARFRAGLPAAGYEPQFGLEHPSQIVSLRVPDPEGLQRSLQDAGVVAAVRDVYLRVAFHFFNDESDVDRVLAVIRSRTPGRAF